jgi:hypothetical protein
MYNALSWPDYNLKTELVRKPDGCRVIVATNILISTAGVDFPDILMTSLFAPI